MQRSPTAPALAGHEGHEFAVQSAQQAARSSSEVVEKNDQDCLKALRIGSRDASMQCRLCRHVLGLRKGGYARGDLSV